MFEDDSFSEDVVGLRNLLRLTELSLLNVGQRLSQSEGPDDGVEFKQKSPPDHLNVGDLQTPDVPPSQSGCVWQERPPSGTAERRAAASFSASSSNSRCSSSKAKSLKMESVPSGKKAGHVRQENAHLHNITNLDAMQYELATFTSQAGLRGPRVGVKNNVAVMSEQIRHLQTALEYQAKELRAAELRAECSQEAAAHSDIVVATLSEELRLLGEDMDNKTALGKRAELQRNQALENAEKLKEAFKNYKDNISIKLKKVMDSESKLKGSLAQCDRQKEKLLMKCTELEKEKVERSRTIGQLKEEVMQAKSAAADLQAQLEAAGPKALLLERRLMELGSESRELASLHKELEELRTVNQSQEQRAAHSHREAQQSQTELASLEAILALLHIREGVVGPVCVRSCLLPPLDFSGTAQLLQLKPGEGYQQLLRVMQSMEAERTKQNNLVERLQERLVRAQEEISTLQSSMAQRASHYQSLHTDLMDQVSQATDAQKELKRKGARVAALEKQLQEKTSAYGQAALTNTNLENQLLEKTCSLQHYQSLMSKKQKEYQQSLEKCKKTQSQQLMEQQHSIELLRLSVEEAQSRVLATEQELSSLHRERDEAHKAALLLQSSLDQLTQQKQVEVRLNEELLQSLKEQADQSATKVCELQSSLSACREELNLYVQQMEEVEQNHESELQRSNDKVSSLQEKLHSASLCCQSSNEQNVGLQHSLQQLQTMLTESTTHISELEESQSLLQTQVASLEQQLERARASLQDEARNKELNVQEKDQDLQEMSQQNTQLSESVSHLTSEMTKCRVELQHLKEEVAVKTSHVSRMEESLLQTTKQLNSKLDMVVDLEEKLHASESDRLSHAQRVQMLEGQLQVERGDLADTLEQLEKLRDVLQRTQTTADDRQASVEKLTFQLSETQKELEERTHEVLDMDNSLKERQGELQQRAQLLAQLEVDIREHIQEMERKVESVQQRLEARESELRDVQREMTDRDMMVRSANRESQEFNQQLHVCRQKAQSLQQELEETQRRCETLTRELDAANERLSAQLQQSQNQREQAKAELDCVINQVAILNTQKDHIQTQFLMSKTQLEQSRILGEQTTSQNNQLHTQLEQLRNQLNQARAETAQLQTRLQASEKTMECSYESLLIKDSEVTRLLARISSLQRAAEHQHLYNHTLSLPALHSPELSSSSSSTSTLSPNSSNLAHSTRLLSPTHTRPCPSSPPHTHYDPCISNQIESHQTRGDFSLHSPASLKPTLREALSKQPWNSPSISVVHSFPDTSWQGISATEATVTSDLSFNPLTYMVDSNLNMDATSMQEGDNELPSLSRAESVCTPVGNEYEEVDPSSLTGMLRFVNQTLAMQEDPSLWSSTGLSQI